MRNVMWMGAATWALTSCLGGSAGPGSLEAQPSASVAQTGSEAGSGGLSEPADDTDSTTPAATDPNVTLSPTPVTYRTVPFANSVSDQRADPGILHARGRYYVYATNRGDGNVPVAYSGDMVHWTQSPNDALPALPSWARGGLTWAPEVASIDPNRYVLYFCARDTASDKQCVGSAVASDPLGPFVPTPGAPLACQTTIGGTIDPSPFTDADGTRYVVFKNDGNCCGNPVHLWLQRMAIDGVTPVGSTTALLTNDQGWEGNLVEAPFLWRHDNTYYLFYSANNYANNAYAIGYATSTQVGGPYQKFNGPWVASSSAHGVVLGPGGQNLVDDDAGKSWLVYHTWRNTSYNNRVLNLAPITWTAQGPVADVSFGVTQTGPNIADTP